MKKTSTRLPALRLDIMVRSRLDLNTTIEQKHATIATAFAELPPPWSWTVPIPAAPRIGGGLCVAATLGRKLGKGVSGYAMYTFRHDYEEDAAMHDDWIDILAAPSVLVQGQRAEYLTLGALGDLIP